ncbi:MAG: MBL fold metallo-hydrolase [Opitutaceae bacterium]|jgi:7,8-dihydropterin-6-yl-methyl-4-(beta-D-ribofuranosyl)aminobenzene 5'-phosphate synthase
MISVTLLCENTARGRGILGEHGLAFWIDTGTHRVLFDTGQGLTLQANALRLGIDLATADAIVVSHGHYDHIGGLAQALSMAPNAVLHLHPAATAGKFSGSGGPAPGRRLSLPIMEEETFRTADRRVVADSSPREIVPGVRTTGEIPRCNDFEDTGGPFFLDAALTRPDPIRDDQSLYVSTSEGIVLLCGCAHAGVINTLAHVGRLTGDAPVRLILGGWHLEHASARRLDETVRALRAQPGPSLGFCHCTGAAAGRRLWQEFPSRCVPVHAGAQWSFES